MYIYYRIILSSTIHFTVPLSFCSIYIMFDQTGHFKNNTQCQMDEELQGMWKIDIFLCGKELLWTMAA